MMDSVADLPLPALLPLQASLTAVALRQLDVLTPTHTHTHKTLMCAAAAHLLFSCLFGCCHQASLTAVALGQLDALKGLPGGSEGLLDLVRHCPLVAEVRVALCYVILLLYCLRGKPRLLTYREASASARSCT